MRLLQLLIGSFFALLAVLAGLVTAGVVAASGALVVLVRRLLGKGNAVPMPRHAGRKTVRSDPDIIDITATEVCSPEHSTPESDFAARASR